MNKIFTAVVVIFLSSGLLQTANAQIYVDPGIGAVFKDNTGTMTPRLNMGIHNILFNRLGVYGTIEIARTPGAKLFKETDERDIAGGIFRVNDFLSVYGGAGMISNGLLSNGFKLKGVRKEAGVSFNIPDAHLNIDIGYSNSSGIAANIGYIIPFGKSSKKQPAPKQPAVVQPIEKAVTQAPVTEPKKPEPVVKQEPVKPEPAPVVKQEEPREAIVMNKVEPKPAPAKVEPAPDSENMTPGIYAVNGVFRYRRNAVEELSELKRNGFSSARIGYRASTGMYYIWLLYSTDDQQIKDYVWKSRESGKLKTVWLLRVN